MYTARVMFMFCVFMLISVFVLQVGGFVVVFFCCLSISFCPEDLNLEYEYINLLKIHVCRAYFHFINMFNVL